MKSFIDVNKTGVPKEFAQYKEAYDHISKITPDVSKTECC